MSKGLDDLVATLAALAVPGPRRELRARPCQRRARVRVLGTASEETIGGFRHMVMTDGLVGVFGGMPLLPGRGRPGGDRRHQDDAAAVQVLPVGGGVGAHRILVASQAADVDRAAETARLNLEMAPRVAQADYLGFEPVACTDPRLDDTEHSLLLVDRRPPEGQRG